MHMCRKIVVTHADLRVLPILYLDRSRGLDEKQRALLVRSQDCAPRLLLKSANARQMGDVFGRSTGGCRRGSHGGLDIPAIVGDHCVDGSLEDLVDTGHLFTAAFHVLRAHLFCNCLPLHVGHWCETLCLEHLDACLLVAEIGLETNKDKRRIRAEMEDLRVPL